MALAAKPVSRTIGAASVSKNNADLVNTAELVRGRVYWYKDREFKVKEVVVVDDELADILEAQHQTVTDREGEMYEKPFFEIKRGVPRPAPKPVAAPRKPIRRLSARQ